jgi:hypothetical protein
MDKIFQHRLPYAPWMVPASRRLPGVQPLDWNDWLIVDEAFAAQMAYRATLIQTRRDAVLAITKQAEPALVELLETVLAHLGPTYAVSTDQVQRPDGQIVPLDWDQPLQTAAALIQEDLCVLQKPEIDAPQHHLTAAVLCFPASWTLTEKIGQPLTSIHAPVKPYDDAMAKRVQRLFDMVRPESPLWRANALLYQDADLYQPRSATTPRKPPQGRSNFLRSERQCILRLARTDAVVFSIHTWVLPFDRLDAEQAAALDIYPIEYAGAGA